jgi:hypothetical protein
MIVYKRWLARNWTWTDDESKFRWRREGWFLFGAIPLFIRDMETRREY